MLEEFRPGERLYRNDDGHEYYVSGEGENIKVRSHMQQTSFGSISGVLGLGALGVLFGWPIGGLLNLFGNLHLGWGGALVLGLAVVGVFAVIIQAGEAQKLNADKRRVERVRRKLILVARQIAQRDAANMELHRQREAAWQAAERDRVAAAERQNRQRELNEIQARRGARVAELEAQLLDLYAEFAYEAALQNPGISEGRTIELFTQNDVLARLPLEGDGALLRESTRPLARRLAVRLLDGRAAGAAPPATVPPPAVVDRPPAVVAAPAKDSAVAQYEARQRASAANRRRLEGN